MTIDNPRDVGRHLTERLHAALPRLVEVVAGHEIGAMPDCQLSRYLDLRPSGDRTYFATASVLAMCKPMV